MVKAQTLPPPNVRVYSEPLPTYAAADYERDCFLSEYDAYDDYGYYPHVVIVKWENEFYVVYGKENYKGFTEYN